ncbi:hypothetical protein AX15_004673 [Amanita polypyramis BW_CC]|nr:hypothetical protein AX15_004673 [Amanita polypyramis BW_CC]
MTGPVRTPANRKHVQPPRPPNAWIIYRSEKIRTLPPLQPGEARRAQADVSRMISEMWKNETEEERSRYERMAEQRKAEHQQKYPGYRFQPQKKEEKQRLREMMKQERQTNARRNRGGVQVASTPTPTFPSQPITHFYAPETQYGPAGPSPPLSAAPSPRTDNAPSPDSDDHSIPTPNASQPHINTQQNASIPITFPFVAANKTFPITPDSCSQPLPSHWTTQPTTAHQATIPTTTLSSTEWNHHTSTDMPMISIPKNSTTEFVSFDMQSFSAASSHEWLDNGQSRELEEALQAFLSTTADPSIFHLNNIDVDLLTANPTGEIEVSMGQVPLAFENLLSPENELSIPDFMSFDFSHMAGPSLQSPDTIPLTDNTSPQPLRLSSELSDNMAYNAEEFLNFDEISMNVIPPAGAPPDSQDGGGTSETRSSVPPCSSSYVPPSGAALSSTRRVGATWKPPFIEKERSPPRARGVPAN